MHVSPLAQIALLFAVGKVVEVMGLSDKPGPSGTRGTVWKGYLKPIRSTSLGSGVTIELTNIERLR